ncbi:uncharacterized protein LOC111868346 isoform X6 [Cryptotermes secundus]|uniref:uncharacterized protein LOC111868346 isoform X6 n=1 Tax=Cryptotermes secundus TaxID=105785 RepID=UPI000CD7D9F9|nr:uncharacterized protein LOC111868346 isoform X6 [Cryptotermes secundus]
MLLTTKQTFKRSIMHQSCVCLAPVQVVVHPEHRGKGLGKFLMAKTEECAKRDGSSSSERQTHQISRSAWGITNICYKGNYYNAGLHSHFYMYYCWNGSSILRDFEITVLKNMLWN